MWKSLPLSPRDLVRTRLESGEIDSAPSSRQHPVTHLRARSLFQRGTYAGRTPALPPSLPPFFVSLALLLIESLLTTMDFNISLFLPPSLPLSLPPSFLPSFPSQPGYQRTMGTPSGTAASNHYNQAVRFGTLQHAIMGQMRFPSPVFKDACLKHFALKKAEILSQCHTWMKEGGPRAGTTARTTTSVTGPMWQAVCGAIEQVYKTKEASMWLEG